MTKPNGHLNGGDHDGGGGKVASLEEARRRQAEKTKAEKRAARAMAAGTTGSRGWRDWVVGGLIVAMAIGYIASLFAGAPHVTREGVQ